jgi:hypothetical protein
MCPANRPVPYVSAVSLAVRNDYMTEDQRFAATRPDVLVYRTEPLEQDVTVFGPIAIDLKVSTTGTDSDFDVKIIDVYPGDYPDFNNPRPAPAPGTLATPVISQMGGYQQLIRGEPFRGKYRKASSDRCLFEPGKPDPSRSCYRTSPYFSRRASDYDPDTKLLVPVDRSQSAKFMDIPKAKPDDFVKATQAGICRWSGRPRVQFSGGGIRVCSETQRTAKTQTWFLGFFARNPISSLTTLQTQ